MKRLLSILCVVALLVGAMSVMPMSASAYVKGDLNDDGRVDTLDVRILMRTVLGKEPVTQKLTWIADMSPDNTLSTADAQVLMRQVLMSDTTEGEEVDPANPTKKDVWNERSISLIGDSISFGAGAADPLPEYSYVSFVKKAVQKANGGNMNYGFTSAYPTAWGPYESTEIHAWPERSKKSDGTTAWICDDNDDGNRLYSIGFTSTTAWATITYTLRDNYNENYEYFCVYYDSVSNGAGFCIANGTGGQVPDVNGNDEYVPTKLKSGESRQTKRTAFYKLSDCYKVNGVPQIIICHDGSTNPVTITGIGYYKNLSPSTVTFNAYVRGGACFTDIADHVLTQAATADTLIFAMGYNDAHFRSTQVANGVFTQKINHLINVCNQNGTKVIITDHVWDNTEKVPRNSTTEASWQTVKKEIKRFAKETNGIYIDQQGVNGAAMLETLNSSYHHTGKDADGIHPNSDGHRLIAKNIIEVMGLTWAEDWT